MKMKFVELSALLAAAFLATSPPARGITAGGDVGLGARVIALGGAYTAVGDDIWAVGANPAGLAYLKRGQMAFEYGRLHLNLSDGSNIFNGFAGAAWPFIKSETTSRPPPADVPSISTATVSAESVAISTSPVAVSTSAAPALAAPRSYAPADISVNRTLSSAVMLGYRSAGLAGHYAQNIFQISYARFIGSRFAAGVSAKAVGDSFTADEYLVRSEVFDYGSRLSKMSFTGDAGIIWNPSPMLFAGLSALNLNEPDVGYLEKDPLPAVYRIGAGMRKRGARFSLDAAYAPRIKELEVSAGFDRSLSDMFALRGGLVYGRFENADSWRIAAGAGFEVSDSIALDYALTYPLTTLKNTYGSHWISFVFRFGKMPPDEIEPGSIERAYSRLSEEKSALESRLAQTEAEKRRLEEILIEEASARIRQRISQAREAAQADASRVRASRADETIKTAAAARTHVVRRGDTLQSLAERYYKDSRHWIEIYNANRDDIGRGGALRPNQVLAIPPHPSEKTSSPARAAAAPDAPSVAPATVPGAGSAVPPPPPPPVPVEPAVVPAPAPPAPSEIRQEPPKPRAASQPRAAVRKHVVLAGENLRSIAAKYYNDPEKWRVILDANKDKIERGQVRPGTELAIP